MPQNNTPFASTAAGSSPGPVNGKYHDFLPFVRRLLAASVFRVTAASFQRLPNFYPVSWPVGALLLYLLLLVVGAWAASFLALLTVSEDTAWMAVVPVVIFLVEFLLIPILKFPACLTKSLSAMRAFITDSRKTGEAFQQKATAWRFQDWLVLLILTASLVIKVCILVQYGAYEPVALLAANYIVAAGDYAAHLGGVTAKVPYFALAKIINAIHRRRRLDEAASLAEVEGRDELEPLAFRYYSFESEVDIPDDEVGGSEIISLGNGKYTARIAGTLDDADRASFLYHPGDYLSRAVLARALARIQLELLDVPEMRPGRLLPGKPRPSTRPQIGGEEPLPQP